jgi:hypothetical protein
VQEVLNMSRTFKASASLSSLSVSLVVTGVALAALAGCGGGSYHQGDFSQQEATAGADTEGDDTPSDDARDGASKGGTGTGPAMPGTAGAPADDDDDDDDDAGGAGGAGGGTTGPADPDALRFENVSCVHEKLGLSSVTEGQLADCNFHVLGKPGQTATLSCEDLQGQPIDCDPNGAQPQQVWPDGAQPLPLTFAGFASATTGMGGSTLSIVLVASDGTETARHRLDIPVTADNGVPDAPTLTVDCGQAEGSTTIEVEAGKNLDCTASVVDPDPDMIEYSIDLASADAPTWFPIPASGGLWGTGFFGWTFFAQAADAGKSFDYTFKVNDYTHAPVTATFTIVVK